MKTRKPSPSMTRSAAELGHDVHEEVAFCRRLYTDPDVMALDLASRLSYLTADLMDDAAGEKMHGLLDEDDLPGVLGGLAWQAREAGRRLADNGLEDPEVTDPEPETVGDRLRELAELADDIDRLRARG